VSVSCALVEWVSESNAVNVPVSELPDSVCTTVRVSFWTTVLDRVASVEDSSVVPVSVSELLTVYAPPSTSCVEVVEPIAVPARTSVRDSDWFTAVSVWV
jgi:hypothetical protein